MTARDHLFRRFRDLGIPAETVPYPAHQTVEEGKALRGEMSGTFTKNLLLRDKKRRLFLVVAHEDRALDLKALHPRVGGNGQLGFATAEQVREVLGVEPGALTPFGIINDAEGLVTVVIDAGQLNFPPLVNTESTGLRPAELVSFVESCGRTPLVVEMPERLPLAAVTGGPGGD